MKDTELRKSRDRALYEVYKRGLRQGLFTSLHRAADWCRSQPAPAFYISPKSLVLYIGEILRGHDLDKLHGSTRDQVIELYNRYLNYRNNHPDSELSRERVCEILVDEPAPRFYMSHMSAMASLRKEIYEARKAMLKRRVK